MPPTPPSSWKASIQEGSVAMPIATQAAGCNQGPCKAEHGPAKPPSSNEQAGVTLGKGLWLQGACPAGAAASGRTGRGARLG